MAKVMSPAQKRAWDAKRQFRWPKRTLAERFWARATRVAGCWVWTGCCYKQGYGRFQIKVGKGAYAHRTAWELTYGPIPEGLHVLHSCDNPPCVRPSHLWLGTHQDNMADMVRKGRNRRST